MGFEMPPVLTVCPKSGGLVPTGVDADELAALPPQNYLELCPDCGDTHEWDQSDAVFAVGPSRWEPQAADSGAG
jgi:hypothetical protein